MGHEPSKYQVAIHNKFKHTSENMLIGAVAGSGKTTTLLQLLEMTTGLKANFLAFNKSIVEELKSRVPKHVKVQTMHGMGMGAIIRKHGKIKVNAKKTGKFIAKLLKEEKWEFTEEDPKKLAGQKALLYIVLPRLVDIYRLTLCQGMEDLRNAADSIGAEYNPEHLQMAQDLIEELRYYNEKNLTEVDFTDMIYLPATNVEYQLPMADVWFIDESQDLSPCQHLLFKRAKRKSRFVSVGDPFQSIYGFSGADSNSFNRFMDYPNTVKMPLSICYRCGQKIAAQANKVHNIIESPDWMQLGKVENGDYMDASGEDMVICRNVKPLIKVFFKLIADGKKCYIKGKDIGESLIRLIKPHAHLDREGLLGALTEELQQIEGSLIERGITNARKHPKYIAYLEKMEAVTVVVKAYPVPAKMLSALERMFGDEGSGIVLSSIHKSKGLEADNVFLLDAHLMPSKYATSEDQLKQEANLRYVAITRAKSSLTYCYS